MTYLYDKLLTGFFIAKKEDIVLFNKNRFHTNSYK